MAPQLRDFEGDWRLSRAITQAEGPQARFEGQALFTPEGEGLRYCETGTLWLGDEAPMRAERVYLWQAEGPEIVVRFEDGRDFHRFTPSLPPLGVVAAAHWCDPDDYRVRYDFSLWPEWSAVWRVKGPHKDYEMRSRYRRG